MDLIDTASIVAGIDISLLSREDLETYIAVLAEGEHRDARRRLFTLYPDKGPLSRHHYPKHMKFFEYGKYHRERAVISANRVGKSFGMGGYETVLHLTGLYPDWWPGRKFTKHGEWWAAGKTTETTRDIIQKILFGNVVNLGGEKGVDGTGLIPGHLIGKITWRRNVADAIDTAQIKHVDGGWALLGLKSFEQGRGSFEGTEKQGIWADEECPDDIYNEMLIRTATTGGMTILTFTPLEGLTPVVLQFLPHMNPDADKEARGEAPTGDDMTGAVPGAPQRARVQIGWDDVPHLDEQTKADLLASTPMYLRAARSRGEPGLGAGAIYKFPIPEIICRPFLIPDHWKRCYGLDVGWNRTAACWGAWDQDSDIVYIYAEHYRSEGEPASHIRAINGRGDWVPGVIDPAARGRSQETGKQLVQSYTDAGLNLSFADNSVEAGLFEVEQRLASGRLIIFESCQNLLNEYRVYRRDAKGKIVKSADHLMDAMRYLIKTGLSMARTKPVSAIQRHVTESAGYDPKTGY